MLNVQYEIERMEEVQDGTKRLLLAIYETEKSHKKNGVRCTKWSLAYKNASSTHPIRFKHV